MIACATIIANAEQNIENFYQESLKNDTIIATDGAIDIAINANIGVDLVIGDMDSAKETKYHSVDVRRIKDQDTTDVEKAIIYCLDQKIKSLDIVNAIGGQRFDHSFYNASLLKKYHQFFDRMRVVTKEQCIEYICNDEVALEGATKSIVSFMPFAQAIITSGGLEYEMQNLKMTLCDNISISNAMRLPSANIKVDGHGLVIYSREIKMHSVK